MRHYLSSTILLVAFGLLANMPVVALNAGEAPAPAPTTTQPNEAPWTMPAAERQALDAVVERAIAAGFPDVKGGTFLHGKISYETKTVFGTSTHRQQHSAEGLHLRLADGRLMVNLRWLMPTTGDGAVDISKLQEVAPDKLNELGTKHRNFARWDTHDVDSELKRVFAPAELPKARAASARPFRGLMLLVMGNDGDLTLPTIILLRMQVPGAENLAVANAMNALWNQIGNDFFAGRAVPLTLIASQGDQMAEWQAQAERFKVLRDMAVPDTANILRRNTIGYFLSSLFDGERSWGRPDAAQRLPADKAGEAALSMLEPSDVGASELRAEIARLVERAALPKDIDAKADLATILRWWADTDDMQSDVSAEQLAEMLKHLDNLPQEQRADMVEQVIKARFQNVTIAELVALVPDAGICRWLDRNRTRTVGDNALRALAIRLGVDPRVLIGRDPKALWTPDERSATAAAITAWWAANRDKPMNELMAAALGKMSVSNLASLVQKTSDKQRAALLTDIAKLWTSEAPKDPDPDALGALLHAAKESKALDAVVAKWPVNGRQRALLATWHLEQLGNAAHVDALLADAVKPPQQPAKPAPAKEDGNSNDVDDEWDGMLGGASAQELKNALRIVTRHPTPDRLVRVMSLFTAPPKGDDGTRVFVSLTTMGWGNGDGLEPWWEGADGQQMRMMRFNEDQPDEKARARAAMPLVFYGLMLNDQRPAPKQLVQQYAGWMQDDDDDDEEADLDPTAEKTRKEKKERKPLAEDLRLADIAGVILANQAWNLGLDDLAGRDSAKNLRELRVDMRADKATRDQVITKQRAIIAAALPLALKAAKLPTAIPGVTDAAPAAGDDVPAF